MAGLGAQPGKKIEVGQNRSSKHLRTSKTRKMQSQGVCRHPKLRKGEKCDPRVGANSPEHPKHDKRDPRVCACTPKPRKYEKRGCGSRVCANNPEPRKRDPRVCAYTPKPRNVVSKCVQTPWQLEQVKNAVEYVFQHPRSPENKKVVCANNQKSQKTPARLI